MNPQLLPWKGKVLPLNYSRLKQWRKYMKLILLCQLFYTTFLQKIEKNKVHFRSFTCNLIKIKNQALRTLKA